MTTKRRVYRRYEHDSTRIRVECFYKSDDKKESGIDRQERHAGITKTASMKTESVK